MIQLRLSSHDSLSKYFVEFQKKSKCFELPPEGAEFVEIHFNNQLIGYYVLIGYADKSMEIIQGFLLKKYRCNGLPKACMSVLEQEAKIKGISRVYLAAHSRFKAYFNFANYLGYRPEKIIFSKELV